MIHPSLTWVRPPNGNAAFWAYCDSAANFCPYIKPSIEHGCMFASFVDGGRSWDSIQAFQASLLGVCIKDCETVRHLRRITTPADAQLLCVNVVFDKPQGIEPFDGHRLLEWPHWILKCLYTDKALMFGKFWPEENSKSLKGTPIPAPPLSFLSIRSSVRPRDPSLLKSHQHFAELIATATDDGGDVFVKLGHTKAEMMDCFADESQRLKAYRMLKDWSKQLQAQVKQ